MIILSLNEWKKPSIEKWSRNYLKEREFVHIMDEMGR